MKKRSIFELALAVLLLSLAGCGEKDGQDKKASSGLMDRLSNDKVFLRVNGRDITKGDFLLASSLFDKITRMGAGDDLNAPNAKAERTKELRQPYTVSELQRRELMSQYAKSNGIVASEKNRKEAIDRFLKLMNRSRMPLEKVVAEIGGKEGDLLRVYLEGDAVDLTMREFFDKEKKLEITDADVMVVSNRWKRSVEVSTASNAFERAILTKAIAEVKSGAAFADVAAKYSVRPQDAKEWEDFDSDDVSDGGPLCEWIKTAKIGDVSGIFELEDGFSVVKVVGHEKEEDVDEKDADEPDPMDETWQLVRICRNSYEPFEEQTREEIVAELFSERSLEIQKKIGDAIMEKAVIEWPLGTNLFNIVVAPAKGKVIQR